MNILLTGTPGTGKTTISKALCKETGFLHFDCAQYIKEKMACEKDFEYDTLLFDEELFVETLEKEIKENPQHRVFDFHSGELLDFVSFDLVVVLRCNTSTLYQRLEERGYSNKKIQENVECEIMQVCLEEIREAFDEKMIFDFQNNKEEDKLFVVDFICSKISSL